MPNPQGRPDKGPRRDTHVRVPEAMLVELLAYNPQMLSPGGGLRYGAMQDYLLNLMKEDLEKQRARQLSISRAG